MCSSPRVLLIQPPTRRMLRTVVPRFVEDEGSLLPPLGLAQLAASLRAAGHGDVAILDADAEGLSDDGIGRRVARHAPDLVGVSLNSFLLLDARAVLRQVRRHAPGARTLVGGPHAGLYASETLGWPEVDLVLEGEADHSVVALVEALAGRAELARVPGLWARGERGPAPELVADLDALPLPARDLLPRARYRSIHGEARGMTTMLTSRGCPWACAFCFHAFGHTVRRRSSGSVVDELRAIAALGLREAFLFDDTFTVGREQVLRTCAAIERADLPVVFDVRTRVDQVDAELLGALRRAGCARVSLGVESGSDATLQRLGKGATVDGARAAVAAARAAGLTVYADFMLGSPGESRRDVLDTIAFALELDPHFAQFSLTTRYPGTALYDEQLARGEDPWLAHARDPRPGFAAPLASDRLAEGELRELLERAYRRFYLRPRFVGRYLRRLRSPAAVVRAVRAGLRVAAGR